MKVLVYLPEEKLCPKGGPLSVGYYYNEEMKRRGEHTLEFTHVNTKNEEIHRKGKNITRRLPKWINEIHRTIRHIISRRKFLSGVCYAQTRDFSQYDIIHFHEAKDMYLERKNLSDYKGIVLYQSHSPLPWGQEQCKDLYRVYHWLIPNMEQRYEEIDRYCFDRADYIIFPCEDAEEPYSDNWPYFKILKNRKKEQFKYILTGIMPAFAKLDKSTVLGKYEIPVDDFVISYVGRHNTVKGYDILKEIASKYFKTDKHAWVVSAGLEAPFTRLKHAHWKEIGFTDDPHSLISASDVFVLPNRVTYFDIVMIEILSLGKIVIASRTGGNKYFEKMGVKGVLLYDTIDEAVSLLSKVKSMPPEERKVLEDGNKEFYTSNLSNKAMYDTYINLLKTIYENKNVRHIQKRV